MARLLVAAGEDSSWQLYSLAIPAEWLLAKRRVCVKFPEVFMNQGKAFMHAMQTICLGLDDINIGMQ